MAFNRLLQPECGGPNPLVAAAQQITARPRVPVVGLEARRHAPGAQLNFTKEFAQQYTGTGSLNTLVRPIDKSMQPTTSNMAPITAAQPQQQYDSGMNQRLISSMSNLQLHHPYMGQQQQQQPSTSQQQKPTAGEQLETKYRNDIISTTRQAAASNDEQVSADKAAKTDYELTEDDKHIYSEPQQEARVDDVEFWQSLSQNYIGPTTFASDRDEYIFDEAAHPLIDEIEDPFAEALRRLKEGDIPSAALLFEAAVHKNPQNAMAWRYLGTTQAQNEKDKSAIAALRKCLSLDPSDQEARLALAVSLANELKRHDACRELISWLLHHDTYKTLDVSVEQYDSIQGPQTESWMSGKKYKYVCDKFLEAARLRPTDPDPDVQTSLGVLFNMCGDYSKAVDCFKAALSVSTDDSLLWNRLGATLANGNRSDEAIAAYRKALELAPGSLRTRYNLAISLIHLNSYDEAAKQLVQILNKQAAGKGSKNVQIRTRSITSTSIWNTLRTLATLSNKPELYSMIDGRDLAGCNKLVMGSPDQASPSDPGVSAGSSSSN